METQATLRFSRHAPRKAGYVARLVRGRNVNEALDLLRQLPRRASRDFYKLIRSAMANAEDVASTRNLDLDAERLFVRDVLVGPGPRMRRFRSASRGRSAPRVKRTAHITVILDERAEASDAGEGSTGTPPAEAKKE